MLAVGQHVQQSRCCAAIAGREENGLEFGTFRAEQGNLVAELGVLLAKNYLKNRINSPAQGRQPVLRRRAPPVQRRRELPRPERRPDEPEKLQETQDAALHGYS